MKQNYVTAVLELLKTNLSVETVLGNLEKVLVSRGHAKLLPNILTTLMTELERQNTSAVAIVTLAAIDSIATADILTALKAIDAPTENYTVKINPQLIGGLVATYGSTQLDQSYQTKLRELYQSIITA